MHQRFSDPLQTLTDKVLTHTYLNNCNFKKLSNGKINFTHGSKGFVRELEDTKKWCST